MKYVVVVPNGQYTVWESTNLRGSPAAHAINNENPSRTLCGKDPDGWDYYNPDGEGFRKQPKVDCKTCQRAMRRDIKLGP